MREGGRERLEKEREKERKVKVAVCRLGVAAVVSKTACCPARRQN